MSPEPAIPLSGGVALELLVHGVGGTTPQEMLDDARTVRITGDNTAAVYRRAADADAEQHPERYLDRPIPEAYSWANLTSGNSSRALWLLLLPFMVVNLAHWMRPATQGLPRSRRLYGVWVRLVALTLTVLLTAAACEVALDLTVWQCAGSAACTAHHSWLGFLSPGQHGWWAQPGRRLALAAVVPAGLVTLLWYLSNRTWSAYESQRPPTTGAQDEPPPGAEDVRPGDEAADDAPAADDARPRTPPIRPALGRPGFWYG
ncbi:membrane protein, partial [Streptomyces sp. 150FB]